MRLRHVVPVLALLAIFGALPAAAQPTTTTSPATLDFAILASIDCTLLWDGTSGSINTGDHSPAIPDPIVTEQLVLQCATNSNQDYDVSIQVTQTAGPAWESPFTVFGLDNLIITPPIAPGFQPLGTATATNDAINLFMTVDMWPDPGQDPGNYQFSFEIMATGV